MFLYRYRSDSLTSIEIDLTCLYKDSYYKIETNSPISTEQSTKDSHTKQTFYSISDNLKY